MKDKFEGFWGFSIEDAMESQQFLNNEDVMHLLEEFIFNRKELCEEQILLTTNLLFEFLLRDGEYIWLNLEE